MKKENIAGMALTDGILEKVSGGVATELEGEDCMIFYLDPNESCISMF